jgi:hypothetical protein
LNCCSFFNTLYLTLWNNNDCETSVHSGYLSYFDNCKSPIKAEVVYLINESFKLLNKTVDLKVLCGSMWIRPGSTKIPHYLPNECQIF